MRNGKAAAFFNGVAYRVAQIQELSLPLLLLIPLHHPGLVADAPGDDLRQNRGGRGEGRPLKEGKEVLIAEDAGFDGLGGPVGEELRGQRSQAVGVTEDRGRLKEGPGQVFPRRKVHRGLAPHRGIHRCQQGGGQLDVPHPPQVEGGGQPRHIPGDPAPQGGDAIGAGQPLPGQKFQNAGKGGEVLAFLPGGEDIAADGKSRLFQAVFCPLQIEGGHVAVADNCHMAGLQTFPQEHPAPLQQTGADGDGVGRAGANRYFQNGMGHGIHSFGIKDLRHSSFCFFFFFCKKKKKRRPV